MPLNVFFEDKPWVSIMWITEVPCRTDEASCSTAWCLSVPARVKHGLSSCRCSCRILLLYMMDNFQDYFQNLMYLTPLSLSQAWMKLAGKLREEERIARWGPDSDRQETWDQCHMWQPATQSDHTTYPKSHVFFSPYQWVMSTFLSFSFCSYVCSLKNTPNLSPNIAQASD